MKELAGRLTWAALGAVLVILVSVALDRPQQEPSPEVIAALRRAGFRQAQLVRRLELRTPLPRGVRPVATVEGRVPPGGTNAPAPGQEPQTITRWIPCPGGPEITPNDLSGGCLTEIVEVGGKPWARVWWDASLNLPGGRVLTRGPLLAQETALKVVKDFVPEHLPARLYGRALASSDANLRVGVTYFPAGRRLGVAGDVEVLGTDRTWAVGLAMRLK